MERAARGRRVVRRTRSSYDGDRFQSDSKPSPLSFLGINERKRWTRKPNFPAISEDSSRRDDSDRSRMARRRRANWRRLSSPFGAFEALGAGGFAVARACLAGAAVFAFLDDAFDFLLGPLADRVVVISLSRARLSPVRENEFTESRQPQRPVIVGGGGRGRTRVRGRAERRAGRGARGSERPGAERRRTAGDALHQPRAQSEHGRCITATSTPPGSGCPRARALFISMCKAMSMNGR